MAVTALSAAESKRLSPRLRKLEDERWLSMALPAPTPIPPGLFFSFPTFSVINWTLFQLGLITTRINWLGDPDLAMTSIIIINIWRGVPFFAITLLAGLQTISPELHEAAAIDGARPWARFWHVTWPLLLPVTMVVMLFSVIQTFADFQLVYVMTGGGPGNATQLL